jgi:hypothetical protein
MLNPYQIKSIGNNLCPGVYMIEVTQGKTVNTIKAVKY